jgi:preprotein translocase SecE subunit
MPPRAFLVTEIYFPNRMKLTDYIKDTRAEMKHVSWPTRSQAIVYTLLVIGVTVATGLLLALFDYGFTYILRTFIVK